MSVNSWYLSKCLTTPKILRNMTTSMRSLKKYGTWLIPAVANCGIIKILSKYGHGKIAYMTISIQKNVLKVGRVLLSKDSSYYLINSTLSLDDSSYPSNCTPLYSLMISACLDELMSIVTNSVSVFYNCSLWICLLKKLFFHLT